MKFKTLNSIKYDVSNDLETISQLIDIDYYKLIDDFKIKNINNPSRNDLEKIYSFA